MNVALRSLHDRLRASGDVLGAWDRLATTAATLGGGRPAVSAVASVPSVLGLRGLSSDWLRDLRALGVIGEDGRWNADRARSVGVALELVADSFRVNESAVNWALVATLPRVLVDILRPPVLRQTTGVLLELIDSAREEILLASPYVDQPAVKAIAMALMGARRRGVNVRVLTSPGRGREFAALADDETGFGTVKISEVQTDVSPVGSHAKVLVVDRERAYVGSANLTAAGLERNIEIGVEINGPQVAELARLLTALERLGVPRAT